MCVKKYNNASYSGWTWLVFILAQVKLNLDKIALNNVWAWVSMLNDIDFIGQGKKTILIKLKTFDFKI